MPGHSCGATHEGRPEVCPTCGASLVSTGCIERRAGGTAAGRLVTDGGQPADGDSATGQSTGGQSTNGQSTGGQPTTDRSTSGETTSGGGSGGQPAAGQATDGGRTAGANRDDAVAGGDLDVGDLVDGLPLKTGATIGVLATLVPYLLLTLASYVPLEREEFGIAAELYATIVGFGPGERFVDLFVGGTDITALGNVDPSDYPSVAAELDSVLATLQSNPEALLLPLYVFAPLVCYLGGRSLAKKYADGDSPVEHLRVGLALPVGALPVTLVVCLAFGVEAVGGAVVLGGLFVPLLFGALGGLTVYAFRDFGWAVSKAYGWLAAVVGLVVAIVLFPLMMPGMISFELPQRVLFGTMGFLSSVNFGVGRGAVGSAIFLLVAAAVVGAGYLRAHRSDRDLRTALDGAHLGASVVLGYLAVVALVAIFLPFLSLVVTLPFGMNMAFAQVEPDVAKFTGIVVLAAIYATVFGAGGGALAVWNRDRENTEWR